MKKFQIYFKSKENENYTLSISRIDEITNTYKLKVIYETFNISTMEHEKLKIKEFHLGANEVLKKIKKIDFNKKYNFDKNSTSYYQISFDENKINSSNQDEILEILNEFNFLELIKINPKEYPYIKNVYEYIHLKNVFINECTKLSEDNILKISEAFEQSNPYEIFEHISYIEKYCSNL